MDYIWQLLAAAGVLGLLGAAVWGLKRRGLAGLVPGARSGGRKLEALERLALSPQHTLHLVRVGEEALLVACSPSSCGVLERVSARQLEPGVGERR